MCVCACVHACMHTWTHLFTYLCIYSLLHEQTPNYSMKKPLDLSNNNRKEGGRGEGEGRGGERKRRGRLRENWGAFFNLKFIPLPLSQVLYACVRCGAFSCFQWNILPLLIYSLSCLCLGTNLNTFYQKIIAYTEFTVIQRQLPSRWFRDAWHQGVGANPGTALTCLCDTVEYVHLCGPWFSHLHLKTVGLNNLWRIFQVFKKVWNTGSTCLT